MIFINALSKTFPGGGGIADIDLAIEAGECVVLLGPSGSGKTTLLRLIAGLDSPDSGSIRLDGRDVSRVPPHLRNVAYVAQRPALYPEMTVGELLRDQDSVPSLLDKLQLAHLVHKRPHELSGGEKQRVALARAIGRGAKIWLLDEPFASLDPPFRAEFRALLHLLAEESRATIIIVTHDPIDAWALGGRVGVLGDGRLQCFGSPEELRRRPGNRFVAFCLGSFSFVDGLVSDGRSGFAGRGESAERVYLSADGSVVSVLPQSLSQRLAPGTHLTLGIRPDDVSLVRELSAPDGVRFTNWAPISAEPSGSGWIITLARGPTGRVRVEWPSDTPPPMGRPADWMCPLNQCVWFDAAGNRFDV